MSNLVDDIVIELHTKRGKHDEDKDRLSDLPDCVLLHLLSFIKERNTKQAVQTSVLSTRWKDLWKQIPDLILHSDDFSTFTSFDNFVSGILRLRGSIPLRTFDFNHYGRSDPPIIKRIANYVFSHSAHLQQIELYLKDNSFLILPSISSCIALTYLKLSLYSKDCYNGRTLFPKSLNFPALTTLDLTYFDFCISDNVNNADPFSTFKSLNTLIICNCGVQDAQILSISSQTLVNLTIDNCFVHLPKIQLSAPSLSTFTFTGLPNVKLCGSTSIKQVNIDAFTFSPIGEHPLVLLRLLLDLPNTSSLKVTSRTLLVLSLLLVQNLWELKLSSLYNLMSLQVEMTPLSKHATIFLQHIMLKNKSRKEASQIKKAFKVGLEPSATIHDRTLGFLIQNSPLAKVDFIDCRGVHANYCSVTFGAFRMIQWRRAKPTPIPASR